MLCPFDFGFRLSVEIRYCRIIKPHTQQGSDYEQPGNTISLLSGFASSRKIHNRLFEIVLHIHTHTRARAHALFTWPPSVGDPALAGCRTSFAQGVSRTVGRRRRRQRRVKMGWDAAVAIVPIVVASVVPQIKHTGSVDFYLGYLLTWSWVITCVFSFSRGTVLIRRLSTVDFSAHGSIASSGVRDSRVCILSTRSNYCALVRDGFSSQFSFAFALMFSFIFFGCQRGFQWGNPNASYPIFFRTAK